MKKYFTIGETAALLGVSTQTLRFYDKKIHSQTRLYG
ncbi:MerR family DNA-binding transcriptional regulator [Morganella morganii]|nr:MerR family DNA-binding transcriptional regulator [Morganella morganii]